MADDKKTKTVIDKDLGYRRFAQFIARTTGRTAKVGGSEGSMMDDKSAYKAKANDFGLDGSPATRFVRDTFDANERDYESLIKGDIVSAITRLDVTAAVLNYESETLADDLGNSIEREGLIDTGDMLSDLSWSAAAEPAQIKLPSLNLTLGSSGSSSKGKGGGVLGRLSRLVSLAQGPQLYEGGGIRKQASRRSRISTTSIGGTEATGRRLKVVK